MYFGSIKTKIPKFHYWAALSLSFRLIFNVNEHNSLGSPGKNSPEIKLKSFVAPRIFLSISIVLSKSSANEQFVI